MRNLRKTRDLKVRAERFCLFFCLTSALGLAAPARAQRGFVKAAELPAGVWSMAFVQTRPDKPPELILGAMDNRLYRLEGGHCVPIADVGGPPLRLLGADLDRDGAEEIIVAAADSPSHLYVFDGSGKLLWKARAKGCYVDVDAGRAGAQPVVAAVDIFGGADLYSPSGERLRRITFLSTPDGPRRIAQPTTVALGDIDGDGEDEVATSHYRGGVAAFETDGRQIWRVRTSGSGRTAAPSRITLPKPVELNGRTFFIQLQRGGNFARNLRIADLDGDGRNEILVGFFRSQLMVLNHDGSLRWNKVLNYDVVDHMIHYVHMDQRGIHKDSVAKSHPIFETVPRSGGKKWIVALQPREDILETSTHFGATDIFLLDDAGRQLQRDIRDATWFRLAVNPAEPDELWLANRVTHSNLYRTSVNTLAEGLPPQTINQITPPVRNWLRLAERLERRPLLEKTPGAPEGKISIVVLYDHASYDMHFFGFETLKRNLLAIDRFFNGRELRNLEYVFRVNLQEVPNVRQDTHYGLVSRQQAWELAEFVERHQIPVILWLSHGTELTLTPETILGFARRAPTAFRGVMQVESGGMRTPQYKRFLKVLQTLALQFERTGHKIFMHTTGSYWSQGLAVDPEGLGRLVREHGQALVPFVKTNNSQSAEQEVGAALALWKAGYVKEWGYTSIDHWTFTNIFRMNAFKMASHMGTVDIAALALGARYILYYPPILRVDRDREGVITRIQELSPQLVHMKAIERLIGKRIIEPIAPHQAESLSPVLFALRRLEDRVYGGPRPGILAKTVHFQQMAPQNASTIFYGPGLGSSKMVPANPHGIYGILPDYLDFRRLGPGRQILATDLWSIGGDEGPVGLAASAGKLRQALASYRMPFAANGVFLGIQRFSPGRYRLFLVDPGHIKQEGVRTTVRYSGPGRIVRVTDRLTGESLRSIGNSVAVTTRPGLFRILDVAVDAGAADAKKQ